MLKFFFLALRMAAPSSLRLGILGGFAKVPWWPAPSTGNKSSGNASFPKAAFPRDAPQPRGPAWPHRTAALVRTRFIGPRIDSSRVPRTALVAHATRWSWASLISSLRDCARRTSRQDNTRAIICQPLGVSPRLPWSANQRGRPSPSEGHR